MKRSLKILFLLFLCVSLGQTAYALEPFDVMDRYTGTRALSMGGAFVAVADDLSAPYWNPAGLTQIKNNQLGTTYINFFDMAHRLSIDGIYHLKKDNTVLGINFVQEGMQDIPKTEDIGGTGIRIGSFDEYKRAINISLAREYNKELSWGLSTRFLFNHLDTDFAFGGSLDAGLLWSKDQIFYVGLMARNIFSRLEWSTSTVEYLGRRLILGLSVRDVFLDIPAVYALDYELNPFTENKWYTGLELWLAEESFAVRTGTSSLGRWTFGVGLVYSNVTFDFCYWQQEFLGKQYLLSFGFDFGPYQEKRYTKKRNPFNARINVAQTELYPNSPLVISVLDPEKKLVKAAVSFPEQNVVKKMQKTRQGYKLTYYFKTQPELLKEKYVQVYLQNKDGDVAIEDISYKFIPRPVKPKIYLPKQIWYGGETLRIKMTVPKGTPVKTAFAEFDEYHQEDLKYISPGVYQLEYPLSKNLKNGVYQVRILIKIENQPVHERKLRFTVKNKK